MEYLTDEIKNAALDGSTAILNNGSAVSYPTLRLRDASNTVLVQIDLDGSDAVAAAVGGVATVNPPNGEVTWVDYSINPIADGTIDHGVFCDKDETPQIRASVGASGSGEDIEVAQLAITTALDMRFSAAPTITQIALYDPTP